jgi:beta-N-acetylhexosaminidase
VFIKAHEQYRVATCLKHFPGHGSATNDSHEGFVDVSDTWSAIELEPYQTLVAEGSCRMVMTAHIFNRTIDPVYPATLSRATMTGILRERFAYDGVIVSDDMQMGAIINNFSFETAIEKAILAGVDIILTGNNLAYDPDFAPKTIDLISGLVANGTISVERINTSYSRIMTMKQTFSLSGELSA